VELVWKWSGTPGEDLNDALCFACKVLTPNSYLEIGVDGGGSLLTVLRHAKPERIVLCDIWNPKYCDHGLSNHEHIVQLLDSFNAHATFLDGDSTVLVPSLSEEFDLITVDGDHSESVASTDLIHAWSLLKRGGMLVFDDVGHHVFPQLKKVFTDFLQSHIDAVLIKEATSDWKNTAIVVKR
jgi:predicted O-methyltransferase YrrM